KEIHEASRRLSPLRLVRATSWSLIGAIPRRNQRDHIRILRLFATVVQYLPEQLVLAPQTPECLRCRERLIPPAANSQLRCRRDPPQLADDLDVLLQKEWQRVRRIEDVCLISGLDQRVTEPRPVSLQLILRDPRKLLEATPTGRPSAVRPG